MVNPASRLHQLLENLSLADAGKSTSEVLSQVFGLPNQPLALMHAIVGFMSLADEVVEFAIQRTNLPLAPIQRYIPQIKQAVSFTNLDAAWGNYKGRITTDCLLVIEMVANVEGIEQEDVISAESFNEFGAELDNLFQLVEGNSEIDKEFRVFVLKQIELIRRAIAEYRISGADGFRAYVENLYFDLARQKIVLKKAKESQSPIFEKFKAVVFKAAEYSKLSSKSVKALSEMKDAGQTLLGIFDK